MNYSDKYKQKLRSPVQVVQLSNHQAIGWIMVLGFVNQLR
jgi:hypothetical protein